MFALWGESYRGSRALPITREGPEGHWHNKHLSHIGRKYGKDERLRECMFW